MSLRQVIFDLTYDNPISISNYSDDKDTLSTIIPLGVRDGVHSSEIKKCLSVETDTYSNTSLGFSLDVPQDDRKTCLSISLFQCPIDRFRVR
jgi:hypothetical protein